MKFRRSNRGFFCLEGLYWAAYCTLFGFSVAIMREYGFSAELCGLATTLQCVVFMLAQPIYGYLVDHITTKKRATVAVLAAGALFALPLGWIYRQSPQVTIAYLCFISLFIYSGGAIIDAWAVSVINKTQGMDFALVRGGGSVFYSLTALVSGNILSIFGTQVIFTLHAVLALGALAVACILADDTKLEGASGEPLPQKREKVTLVQSAKVLLREPRYVVYTICSTLYCFANRAGSTYLPLVLEPAGGNSSHFGVALFIASGCEIIFMLLASRLLLRGIPHTSVYMVTLCIWAVRLLLFGAIGNLWLLISTMLLQAMGVGFFLRVNSEYLVSLAPEGHEGMAIMLSNAVSNGIGCVLGSYVGGLLIGRWGVRPYLLICTVIMAAAAVIFLPTVLRDHRSYRQLKLEHLLVQHHSRKDG